MIMTLQIPRCITFRPSVVLLAKLIDRRAWMHEHGITPLERRRAGFNEPKKVVERYIEAVIQLAKWRIEDAQDEIIWPLDVVQ